MVTLACTLLMVIAPFEPLATAFGHTPAAAMTGNGRLTVSLDAAGRVVSLRWPSPGYYEHGLLPVDGEPARTLQWAIGDGKTMHWAGEESATQDYRAPDSGVVRNQSTAGPYRVQQDAFVHPALDALLVRVRIHGELPPQQCVVVWRAAPTSRLIAETPVPARNSGATLSFHDGGRVYAVKPHDHSAATRARLETAAASRAGIEALAIEGPAIWLGMDSHPAAAAVHLLPRETAATADESIIYRPHARTGPADAWLTLTPEPVEDGWEAWLVLSAAETRTELDEFLQLALERRETLLEGADRYWRVRLQQARVPGAPESPEAALGRRALLTILMLQDRLSGAIVRAPVSQPLLAVDRPSDSVWAAQALAEAGFTAEAQRHWRFLAGAMRDGRRRTHDGSFAEAYYADGVEAMPPHLLDTAHSAWFIWATNALAGELPAEAAAEFHATAWGPVQRAADFVHGWWDPVRRRPLAAFDRQSLRDRARPEQLLTAYGALDHALALAAHMGERRDDWVSRRAELRALIDYHLVDEEGRWRLPDPSAYWPMGAFPLEAAIWNRLLEEPAAPRAPHDAAARIHFQVRAAATRTGPLPPGLAGELSRIAAQSVYTDGPAQDGFWPDSLTAAHVYLALRHAEAPPQPVTDP